MLIALDYDGTYTEDPIFWNLFIKNSIYHDHEVICVTMRYDNDAERIKDFPGNIIYTGRTAKQNYTLQHNINIDVWIDDSPQWIVYNSL